MAKRGPEPGIVAAANLERPPRAATCAADAQIMYNAGGNEALNADRLRHACFLLPHRDKACILPAFATLTRFRAQVSSRMSVVGPFFLTDSMPLSRAEAEEYISLLPMTSPFAAFRTK